jgi:hypothetical protein
MDRIEKPESEDTWQQAIGTFKVLFRLTTTLANDYPGTVESLRHNLQGPDSDYTLLMLNLLDVDYTEALIDELVSNSLSHRKALRVRQVLGRLSHESAEHLVPPAVWRQLHDTSDYDAYRRMAELLSHLGLYDALGHLSTRALASSDPDIREVGEDFARL